VSPPSRRALNRATLARQSLLARSTMPVVAAVGHLAGLQAQVPNSPYLALWTRLAGFERAALTDLLARRQVVRATMMRGTLHVVTATDFLRLRTPLQPALTRAMRGFMGRRVDGLDADRLVADTRALLAERPHRYGEIGRCLRERWPDRWGDRDEAALGYTAFRACVPVVQMPPGGTWGSTGGEVPYTTAEAWLGEAPAAAGDPTGLVLWYLAAFGPATIADIQAWAGMANLRATVTALRPRLRVVGALYDVPDGPLPDEDVPAPVRFLPEYDSLVLSHADRSRVIADEHRRAVFLSGGRVRATVLVDGFVRGTWTLARTGPEVSLRIEPFGRVSKGDRAALTGEGERLLAFVADGSGSDSDSRTGAVVFT
jgi:DNA glycosylase AlkZ-like